MTEQEKDAQEFAPADKAKLEREWLREIRATQQKAVSERVNQLREGIRK